MLTTLAILSLSLGLLTIRDARRDAREQNKLHFFRTPEIICPRV